MTPADACAPARSPRLVRLLILGALGLGLAGLSLPSGHPALQTVAVTTAAAQTPITADVLQGDLVERHASRSRPLTAAVARPHRKPAVHQPTWVRPSYAAVTSPYGIRWGRMHKGIDFGAHYGDPIRAIGDGVVVGAGYQASEGGYGQITIIRHADGFYSAYAHQSRMAVHVGQRVKAGQVIGYVGATGHVTGPHLHFEIRTAMHGGQINPLAWLRAHHVRV